MSKYILFFLLPAGPGYESIVQSPNLYEAAEKWLTPGGDAIKCGICYSMCLSPRKCIRRGDANTDTLRTQMETMERNYPESDWTRVFEKMGTLQAEIHDLEEPSRVDRQTCCNSNEFVCQTCLERHIRSHRVGHETCPMCRNRVWRDIFLPLLPEAMTQICKRFVRFACDHQECRDAKPFETPLQLAIHFRDRHEEHELKQFAARLAVLDYQRLRSTRSEEEQSHQQLAVSTLYLVRQAAQEIFFWERIQRLPSTNPSPPRERSRSR